LFRGLARGSWLGALVGGREAVRGVGGTSRLDGEHRRVVVRPSLLPTAV
jgi:hypothetical protein